MRSVLIVCSQKSLRRKIIFCSHLGFYDLIIVSLSLLNAELVTSGDGVEIAQEQEYKMME